MRDFDRRREGSDERSAAPASPGKRTRTMSLPGPVQRRGRAPGDAPDEHDLAAAAARGIETPSSPLPHGDVVQAAFGRHRIDHVRAHEGPAAAASAEAIGAEAYATGGHVVLGGMPTLFTVAHEAAHVVQQRAGVARKGGGDGDRFERHADAVAEAVVAGRSAEPLLDEVAPPGHVGSPIAPVQRIIKVGGRVRKTLRGVTEHKDVQRMHEDRAHYYRFRDPEHLAGYADGRDTTAPDEEDVAGDGELDSGEDSEMEPETEAKKPARKLRTGGKRGRHDSSDDDEDAGDEADTESDEDAAPRKRARASSPAKAKAKAKAKGKGAAKGKKLDPSAVKFLTAFGAHSAEAKTEAGADKTRAYRESLVASTTTAHRDADRLAFTLEQMAPGRVCVAVAEHKDGYDVFANRPDDDLASDGKRLADAADDLDKMRAIQADIEALKSSCRLERSDENVDKREAMEQRERERRVRRFMKTLRLLHGKNEGRARRLSFSAPGASELEAPVHAEQQATSHAHEAKKKYVDMGISKLCCLKCWMALEAAEQENIHKNLATGLHGKSYESTNGWPIPDYVEDNTAVLKSMVGAKAYAILKSCPEVCNAALRRNKVPGVKGAGTTDIVSSGEEYDHEKVLEAERKAASRKPGKGKGKGAGTKPPPPPRKKAPARKKRAVSSDDDGEDGKESKDADRDRDGDGDGDGSDE